MDYDLLGENCEYVIIYTICNLAVMSAKLYNRSYWWHLEIEHLKGLGLFKGVCLSYP